METIWFILGAILSFGAGLFFWIRRKRLLLKGILTEAEVMGVIKAAGHYYTMVRFLTVLKEEIIHKYDMGNVRSKFKKGDKITLCYDPKNPKKFIMVGKMEKWTPLILMTIGILILTFYFIFFKN